jgi:hypothetical protein
MGWHDLTTTDSHVWQRNVPATEVYQYHQGKWLLMEPCDFANTTLPR